MSLGRLTAAVTALLLSTGVAWAQDDCRQEHVTQPGDSLISIAQTYLGDRKKWSSIYYANEAVLGGNLVDLPSGLTLSVPCLKVEKVTAVVATPLLQDVAGINLLTGGNYAPFTDQGLVNGGLITELVNAAMEATPDPLPYTITWEDDWEVHLFPKLNQKEFDMGFPWFQPDCAAEPDNERCKNFHFSDPLFNILVMAFHRADAPLAFESDADMHGKTLCRPAGYFTHDLDSPDRQWLTKGLIRLEQPATPKDCFDLLMQGQVDAVAINEFTGREAAASLGLTDQISTTERPISSESLHIVISKRHWRGTTHLYRLNAGLRNLRSSARYEEIVSKHMSIFLDGLE